MPHATLYGGVLRPTAGVALLEPALEVSPSNWDKTLDLNLKAAFFLSQLVAREMIRTGGGKIVNIGSQAGMIALERHVAYMASKAAIIEITKVLAVEWAKHNVQVNAISPTVTMTELGKKAWAGEVGQEFKRKLPAGRFADPEEIAACALFLASQRRHQYDNRFKPGHRRGVYDSIIRVHEPRPSGNSPVASANPRKSNAMEAPPGSSALTARSPRVFARPNFGISLIVA